MHLPAAQPFMSLSPLLTIALWLEPSILWLGWWVPNTVLGTGLSFISTKLKSASDCEVRLPQKVSNQSPYVYVLHIVSLQLLCPTFLRVFPWGLTLRNTVSLGSSGWKYHWGRRRPRQAQLGRPWGSVKWLLSPKTYSTREFPGIFSHWPCSKKTKEIWAWMSLVPQHSVGKE